MSELHELCRIQPSIVMNDKSWKSCVGGLFCPRKNWRLIFGTFFSFIWRSSEWLFYLDFGLRLSESYFVYYFCYFILLVVWQMGINTIIWRLWQKKRFFCFTSLKKFLVSVFNCNLKVYMLYELLLKKTEMLIMRNKKNQATLNIIQSDVSVPLLGTEMIQKKKMAKLILPLDKSVQCPRQCYCQSRYFFIRAKH